jgi:KaiC/GvpD/RAD55 family RecA-like ATPase
MHAVPPAPQHSGGVPPSDAPCAPLLVLIQRIPADIALRKYLDRGKPQLCCHLLAQGIDLEILGELAPGAFHYGMTCVAEFESHSLWHEISLTIAADALSKGIKTEYHVFQHTPADIRSALKEMGVEVEKFEERGKFRIMDTYTPTTPLKASSEGRAEPLLSGTIPDVARWERAIRAKLRQGFEEEEKRWLHIDDNEAILLQFNNEEYITKGWRTTLVPMVRARELLVLHALVTGVASESFYRKREASADAIIDIKTEEEGRRLETYIRLRALRGARFDSRWRRIELAETGRVRLSSGRQAFGFESDGAEKIFSYLLNSFVDDHFRKKESAETAGWRSLVQIAKGIGAPTTSIYSPTSSASLGELIRKGVAERKFLSKQRGRGGRVTKMRIAYQKSFVKEYVVRYVEA